MKGFKRTGIYSLHRQWTSQTIKFCCPFKQIVVVLLFSVIVKNKPALVVPVPEAQK